MGDSCPGFWWYGLRRKQKSKLTTYHPVLWFRHSVSLLKQVCDFFFHPLVDKANRLKKYYLGIISFLETNFDAVPTVSFGEEWNCVEKINSFVHLNILH